MAGESAYRTFLVTLKPNHRKLFQAGGDVSGNLGFTYGIESSEEAQSRAYLRVWLWRQSRWWLAFDIVTK